MLRTANVLILTLCLALAGCRAGNRAATAGGPPPLFDGIGSHRRPVTTSSSQAQRYFDQGLTLAYAFNHDEAIRSFTEAARLDPDCAMAWWGVALCHGPHINNPTMTTERSQAAWDALQKAVALKNKANPTERALIDALSRRYAFPIPEDRIPLDQAYARAMRDVWQAHRRDADVGALFAEAMMDLRPWDLWTDDGKPQPGTEEIVAVLEEVQRLSPDHPGALHLYIHAIEASPHPEKAMAAADRLRNLVPMSGHLVHMPSHIDVLTGRWALASDQNVKAIDADRRYRKLSPRQDFYRVYMTHNHHMLMFAAMMEGRGRLALQAARELVNDVPEDYARREAAFVDPYMGAPYDALKRFGRWDDLLREPQPPDYLPITTAMWRFHRGLAFAAKGQVAEAVQEQAAFEQAAAKVPADAVMAINPAKDILAIARHMLRGEIAFRRAAIDEAVSELRRGIEIEDRLSYMEPPEWIQPVRHTLGAILVHAGRYDEAEKVYREDLVKWPNNGWSLYGLTQSLRGRGAGAQEIEESEKRFREVWARADQKIGASCLCVTIQ